MVDHVAITNLVDLQSHRSSARADCGCKAECEEANEGGDEKDDAYQTHLFSPSILFGLLTHASQAEEEIGTPKGDEVTVGVPQTGRPSICGLLLPLALFLLGLKREGISSRIITVQLPAGGSFNPTATPCLLVRQAFVFARATNGLHFCLFRAEGMMVCIVEHGVVASGGRNDGHFLRMPTVVVLRIAIILTSSFGTNQADLASQVAGLTVERRG